ncbi:60S ribosomal export protein NMD3-like [Lineus longissimus]|uniref:60S ribosomal export protein NMD3-like n=1 Tax=Lineus longissimus TaxID=88925 RepID=UPI002B4E4531
MEYTTSPGSATGRILCCECGTAIDPNPTNMCVACLRTQVDITEGIPKSGTLHFCRNCERYLTPPDTWVKASLESRELLSVCLKKLKGLSKVRLVDAGFVWTEPHSKRIKVKITIQKEVVNSAVLEQVFVVEFTVNNQMCTECHRVEAKDFWRAVAQVRQKETSHKKTLFYLEQMILKHKAHVNTVGIKPVVGGIDFFFAQKQDAKKLVDFLQCIVPCKYQTAQQLVSHDPKSNIFNYKSTFSVEIPPICKDNVVCLPAKLAQSLGNLGQICVCYRVSSVIHLIDPNTCQIAEVPGPVYWRAPFHSICGPKQLQEFIVMQIDEVFEKDKKLGRGHGQESKRHSLAEVYVVKSSEIGSDQQHFCRTHLGHLLSAGDSVLGFDMTNANVNNEYLDKMRQDRLPDVVLVKKVFGDRSKRIRKRKWKLQHLAEGTHDFDAASVERDYNDFLEDLEEDPAIRQNVNIYRDAAKVTVETETDTDDDDLPQISLQEMLDDLHIVEDATGGEGADMME